MIYILIFSSVVTLLLTLAQLHREYRYDLSLIESHFDEIQTTNKESIETNLWLLNFDSMSLLLEGILRKQEIVFLQVTDTSGKVVLSRGAMPKKDFRQREIPLNYSYRDKSHHLGQLKVASTLEYVYQRLIDTALIILVTQAVKTFLVSLFIIFIVWQFITRHLKTISEYSQRLELSFKPVNITLNRKESHWTKNDELNQFLDTLNTMRQKLYQSYIDIEHQSLHDPLTGLPNRRLLEDRLGHELQQSERTQQFGALMFIDLDHFKLLNDSLGHSVGDVLLHEISGRFQSVLRQGDTIARIGGDEFIVLLNMLSSDSSHAGRQARAIAANIQQQLQKPFKLKEHSYQISASIGICLFKGEAEDCETILKHADNAMYQAKPDGRNAIRMYHSNMQEATDYRLSTERKLLQAIDRHEFILHYQPKYNLNRQIVSAEVLVRWLAADGTLIPPDKFIQIAEDSGLIVPIGAEVLRLAFQQASGTLKQLKQSGLKSIAINVSPRQFNQPDFAQMVIAEASNFNLDPEFFILELTEEAVVRNIDRTIEVMNRLKRAGFNISIDDFGTGYSSLRYLKDFPIDELKIDQSFVSSIGQNQEDMAIVSTIIAMAKNLGLNVVAEGVETEQQLELLVNNGCQTFQGFLFSRPVSHTDFMKLLSTQIGTGDSKPSPKHSSTPYLQ